MPRDIVVVFVHGINVNCQDYYQVMRDEVMRRMPRKARDYVVFRAVFWADIVRGRQQEYLLYARTAAGLTPNPLHRLVIEGLGDAAAYQKTYSEQNSSYYEIQERLKRTIGDAALNREDSRPLVFVGHSLGCHIISSFAWDVHKLKGAQVLKTRESEEGDLARRPKTVENYKAHLNSDKASPFERLDTLAGLVTMGSNMPLFTFTFGPQNVHPITRSASTGLAPAFPGPSLADAVRKQSRWLNFFSVNDPLGYPLKPLNDAYEEERLLVDCRVASEGRMSALCMRGGLRQFLALRAHTGYWKSGKICRATAHMLHDLIFADEIAAGNMRPRSSPLPEPQKSRTGADEHGKKFEQAAT